MRTSALYASVLRAKNRVSLAWNQEFDLGVIAGSGIHHAIADFELIDTIDYSTLLDFPASSVAGHSSVLQWLRIQNRNVLVFCGRFHLYEGYSLQEVVKPVALASLLGIRNLVCTNAAGGLRSTLNTGDIVLTSDIINNTGCSFYLIEHSQKTSSLDSDWTAKVLQTLSPTHSWLGLGSYASVIGPSYETRAEISMFTNFADTIGMSTVHEAHCAQQLGMRVMAFSLVSNVLSAAPVDPLLHDDVVRNSRRAADRVRLVLECCCHTLPQKNAR